MQRRGGKWNAQERQHHINALELKAAEIALLSLVKNKSKIHVHFKMDNTTAVSYVNKMGGDQIFNLDQNCQEHMGILSWKGDHSYCRAPTRSPKSNSRLGEPEGNRDKFKQLETKQSNIQSDQQTIGSNQTGFVCRETECSSERLCSWKPDQIAVATDAFMIKWTDRQAYAFAPFCLVPRCLAKVEKEGGELIIVTPSWQTQAFYSVLLNMTVRDPILLPTQDNLLLSPEGKTHPLIVNKTLKLVVWTISSDQSKCNSYQETLQDYLPQHGAKGHNQLITTAGNTGVAGILKNKLIPFVPLWNK